MGSHQRSQPAQHNQHSEQSHHTSRHLREQGTCGANEPLNTTNKLAGLAVPHLSPNELFMENSGGLIRLIVLGDKEAHYVHPKDEVPLAVKNCPPRAICKAVGGSALEVIATSQIVKALGQRPESYPTQTLQTLITQLISPLQLTACLKEMRQRNPDKATASLIINDSRELGDKIKATIGAIYLTQGLSAANLFVCRLLETPLRQIGEGLHRAHRVNSPATPTHLPHGLLDRISLCLRFYFYRKCYSERPPAHPTITVYKPSRTPTRDAPR